MPHRFGVSGRGVVSDPLTHRFGVSGRGVVSDPGSFVERLVLSLQFQTELRKILVSLIEVAQKLLALNPDAVELFRKANGRRGPGRSPPSAVTAHTPHGRGNRWALWMPHTVTVSAWRGQTGLSRVF